MGKKDSEDNKPKEGRRFSQEQYDMLKRCSDKKDITEWNEWRKVHREQDILLEKAELRNSFLKGAQLCREYNIENQKEGKPMLTSEANLQGANFAGAQLEGADLSGTNLQRADFSFTNLKGARLGGAQMHGADLAFSELQGADIGYANLEGGNVWMMRYSRTTRCSGVNTKNCYGSDLFIRFVNDATYLVDFRIKHPAIYWIWFVLSDCGRSIALWAGWSLAFAVFFAHVFYRLGPGAMKVADLPWNFSTVVYYSVVTFTTLGFGDVVPKTNAAAWWVMAEVITGYVMLGGLISIFANKLARRS